MKNHFFIIPLTILVLTSCGGAYSISNNLSDSASDSSSDSSSVSMTTGWSSEEKSVMDNVLGSGHYIPYIELTNAVFSDGMKELVVTSSDDPETKFDEYASILSSTYGSMSTNVEGRSMTANKTIDTRHYIAVTITNFLPDPFTILATYYTMSDKYPEEDLQNAFSSSQLEKIPSLTKNSTGDYFEYMIHKNLNNLGCSYIVYHTSNASLSESNFTTSLLSYGYTFDSENEYYVQSEDKLIALVKQNVSSLEVSLYAY